jgi:hypothetical protein
MQVFLLLHRKQILFKTARPNIHMVAVFFVVDAPTYNTVLRKLIPLARQLFVVFSGSAAQPGL